MMNEWMTEQCMDRQTEGWMVDRMRDDGWMERTMNGWMDG